jgi:2-iminobutanoate/2-iminopropanoate deaminase
MHSVETRDAPAAGGHYSQGIVHNGVVYVAGQLPIDPKDRNKPIGSIEEQTERTLRNVEAILVAAGSGLDRVLQMTIYISDIELWGGVNAAYSRIMGSHKPARAVVPVKDLHYGYQIEIQAIAAV